MTQRLPADLKESLEFVTDALETRMAELLGEQEEEGVAKVLSLPRGNKGDAGGATATTPLEGEEKVMRAMRYSALSGGKRLRPFLVMASASLFRVSWESALNTAAAIEFIHTYSLVHDDLPAMDDDALRRGQPSCHVEFGEATAILAGDGLLTYAFELLSDPMVHTDPSVRCKLIAALAKASGVAGMVGGQMMDLEAEHRELTVAQIIRLQRLKTGELFAMSCDAGAILGKAHGAQRQALRGYAHDLGLAFQITDDLLDVEGSRADTGKEVNKDKIAGKATLVSVMGVERAREHAQILAQQAIEHLDAFDKKADRLRQLAKFVITRNY